MGLILHTARHRGTTAASEQAGATPLTIPDVSGSSGDALRAQGNFVKEALDRSATSSMPRTTASTDKFVDLLQELGTEGVAKFWKDRLHQVETIGEIHF